MPLSFKPEVIYFDTNFFYNIKNNKYLQSDLNLFNQYIKEHNIQLYYSSFSFLEIASHLNEKEKKSFFYYRDILKFTDEYCGNNILIHPNIALCKIFKVEEKLWELEYSAIQKLNILREHIINCKTYDEYLKPKKKILNGNNFLTINIKENVFEHMRNVFENSWLKYMQDSINLYLKPTGYIIHKNYAKSQRYNKKSKRQLTLHLNSEDSERDFIENLFKKIQKGILIGKIDKNVMKEKVELLSAYYNFMKNIMLKIANEGYSYEKNKNDFNDSHFLIYLGLFPRGIFITEENFKKKIIKSVQLSRIMNLKTFLTYI